MVGFEVETRSIDYSKIKVSDKDDTCTKLFNKDESVQPQRITPQSMDLFSGYRSKFF